MEFSIIIIVIVVVSILATFLLNQIFKKKRYIKYIPVMIMLPMMFYYFVTMYTAPSEGFEDLGRFVMGLLLLAASLPSLICSIVIDVVHKNRIN